MMLFPSSGAEKVRVVMLAKHCFTQLERPKSMILGRLDRTDNESK
jgi:hypothetical protein